MAYSSAITLCSGARLYDHNPVWTSYISIGLAVVTLLLVTWNYKGKRTVLAALLILAGSGLILDSELRTGQLDHYYLGSAGLLLGVWVNGNLYFFLKRFLQYLQTKVDKDTDLFRYLEKASTLLGKPTVTDQWDQEGNISEQVV